MTPRPIRALTVAAGLLAVAAAAAPGAAQAAEPKFTCEASAIRGSILGQAVEPVVYGRGQECKTGQATPTAALPALPGLKIDALVAAGTKTDDALKPSATAAGGLAGVRVQALPALPIPLPDASAAIAALPAIPIPAFSVPGTVLVPGVPVPALSFPASSIDLKALANAALPGGKLPTADLLSLGVGSSLAGASCSAGKLSLAGSSTVGTLKVLGQEVSADGVARNLNLIDTANFDPKNVKLADVQAQLAPEVQAALAVPAVTTAVQAALDTALAQVQAISIPATVARVKVTAGSQTKTATELTQQAARVEVSIANVSLIDAVVGEAKVSAVGACPVAAAPAELGCTERKLVLVDVFQQGNKGIKLKGAADKAFAGKTVSIRFGTSKKVVAKATVGENGGFSTFAKTPPKSIRNTNDARYTAVRGKEKSLSLKLTRRMRVSRVLDNGKQVTITGFVRMPLAAPAATINLRQRIQCGKQKVIATTKPNKDGRYTFKVKSPGLPAVYRATTRVRNNKSNPKTFPTFTLPRGVDLLKR